MLRTIACALALVSGAVLADGVPLITARPAPLPDSDPAWRLPLAKHSSFVKFHPISLNKAAFGANVLTVTIDGQAHRFVGSMRPKNPPPPKAVKEKQPNMQSWSGTEPGGGTMTLSKDEDDGSMLGTIFLPPARLFTIMTPRGSSTVLVETDANVTGTVHLMPLARGPK